MNYSALQRSSRKQRRRRGIVWSEWSTLDFLFFAFLFGSLAVLAGSSVFNSKSNDVIREADRATTRLRSAATDTVSSLPSVHGLRTVNSVTTSNPTDSVGVKMKDDDPRAEGVREAFRHAWKSYKQYAWGKDTLRPVSKSGVDDFLGMAMTAVDAMDTALLMGETQAFDEARGLILKKLHFGSQENINVFETTIRVVGGLLGTYCLEKELAGFEDKALLEKVVDLADRLLIAFESPTGIPFGTVGLRTHKKFNPSWAGGSTISEVGTLQVEFRYLSHLTGDTKYKEAVDRVSHRLFKEMNNNANLLHGLFPMFVNPDTGRFKGSLYTMGARVDSLYEYFLKGWVQTSQSEPWLRYMYDRSVEGMEQYMVAETSGSQRLTYVGEYDKVRKRLNPKMDHLVCFVPGMLALGTLHSTDDELNAHHLELAKKIMRTCFESYASTSTGLSPEIFDLTASRDEIRAKDGAKHSLLRPETVESLFIMWRVTKDPLYREWGWEIMKAINGVARVAGGFTSIKDVTVEPSRVQREDKMESFFLAETLKYLYLLFAPESEVPLDKFLFNTEAHVFPILPGITAPVEGQQVE